MKFKILLKKYLRNLERKKIITRKPDPIYPFLLAFLYLLMLIIFKSDYFPQSNLLTQIAFIMTIFTFVFAILHWIVVIILNKR